MSSSKMQFVAVVGGLWELEDAVKADAKNAARDIGAELAKAGFGLVVYYSDEESLETHVVSGYCDAWSDDAPDPVIRVRYSQVQRTSVKFAEQDARPDLFEYRLFPGDDWEAPFYQSLTEEEGVDAVLLLSGGTSTLIAGQISVARRLPILAVDQFGGAAAKIWNQLAQAAPGENRHSWGTRPAEKFVKQLKQECDEAASRRTEAHNRERLLEKITSQREQTKYAAAAFIILLVTLFAGMSSTPGPVPYPAILFVGLISAGATGALLTTILGGPLESHPQTSLLLGGIAGFVVGLAYLIPQWIGAPGILGAMGDVVSNTAKIQFVCAVLIAIPAGVGFDKVFSRLRDQAENVSIGPPL